MAGTGSKGVGQQRVCAVTAGGVLARWCKHGEGIGQCGMHARRSQRLIMMRRMLVEMLGQGLVEEPDVFAGLPGLGPVQESVQVWITENRVQLCPRQRESETLQAVVEQ